MKLESVVFDMDGVLLDTEPLWAVSMLAVAESYGLDMTLEKMKYTTGLKINEVTDFWKKKYGWSHPISSQSLAEEIVDHIIDNSKKNASVLEGIEPNLVHLQSQSIPIGVATSSPERMMNELTAFFNLKDFFQVMVSAEKLPLGKPHPEVYLAALSMLGATSYKSIAIEDSINGIVAAKAARMKVIALPEHDKLNAKQFGIADMVFEKLPTDDFSFYQKILL